jgi:hypothetical protein
VPGDRYTVGPSSRCGRSVRRNSRVRRRSRRLIHTVNAESGLTAPFVSAEDLIANEQSARREEGLEQDLADAAAVRRANRRIPDEESGYNTRLPPRFFAHIRDKLLPARLCRRLNRAPRTE